MQLQLVYNNKLCTRFIRACSLRVPCQFSIITSVWKTLNREVAGKLQEINSTLVERIIITVTTTESSEMMGCKAE